MDNLQLHIKVALLSGQLQASHAKNQQLYSASLSLIEQTKQMRDQIDSLIKNYPTDTHIESVVKECNEIEKRQWVNLVDEAREVIHG